MLDLSSTTLLVVAPHADDEVIGAGGLMAKVKAAGGRVFVMYLTNGETQDFTAEGVSGSGERLQEIEAVAELYGFDGWRMVWGQDHHLQLDVTPQKDIVHEIERGEDISLEAVQPDMVVLPPLVDYNQDHRAAALAGFTACRPALAVDKHVPSVVLSYEAPMSFWAPGAGQVEPNVVVGLSDEQLEQKLVGMNLHASQVRGEGHTRNDETLRALARLRGSLLGVRYAEGFHAHKVRG